MNSKVIIQLGQTTRVTLSSHEVARLSSLSKLISFFLDPGLRSRWSERLSFPEEVLSKDHLLILVGRKKICKPKLNIIHFIRTCHYLLIDEEDVFDLLNVRCFKCIKRNRYGSKCRYHHGQDDGYYDVYSFIPVLYFLHYVAQWEGLYRALTFFLDLRFFVIDESWPYHVFRKTVRALLRSRDRWYDNDHFFLGEFRRQGCFARGCKLCQPEPPDSDGDGWT